MEKINQSGPAIVFEDPEPRREREHPVPGYSPQVLKVVIANGVVSGYLQEKGIGAAAKNGDD